MDKDNEKIKKAFDEIFENYSCLFTRNELEELPHNVQNHIADVYFKRPYDEENPDTYDISRNLEKTIYKEINIDTFKKIINADELQKNGINVEIDALPSISMDYCFNNDMSENEIKFEFKENIRVVTLENADKEKMEFSSYEDLKKILDNPKNSFFQKTLNTESIPVPIKNFSQAGAEKLREMTENSETYVDFLKFQGRVFKHNTNVALEFFTQRPDTKFIATKSQWELSKRTVAQGSEAIRFVDSNNKITDYYDFSQVEKSTPPNQWIVNVKNAGDVKSHLKIPENVPLINGIINATIKSSDIMSCMSALGIPSNDYKEFANSYLNAIRLVMVGRLEIGNNKMNIPPNMTAIKMLKTESQKLTFLTNTTNVARNLLKKIENAVIDINMKEKKATKQTIHR